MAAPLVSTQLRGAVRDQMSGTTLHEIHNLWNDEGFPPPTGEIEPVGGERVTLYQQYLNQVDWEDASQVSRVLAVFQESLKPLFNPDPTSHLANGRNKQVDRLRRLFSRNGYHLDEQGRITALKAPVLTHGDLQNLTDSKAIREHLNRIATALDTEDVALAIGSAKELMESTAKLVLTETETPFDDGYDLPKLAVMAEQALHLHPQQAAPGPDGSNTVKKILGAAHTIAGSIAELRNNYGTGHGRSTAPSGLGTRHSRLAVNAAQLWCQFLLDTLNDPHAPWTKRHNTREGPST